MRPAFLFALRDTSAPQPGAVFTKGRAWRLGWRKNPVYCGKLLSAAWTLPPP